MAISNATAVEEAVLAALRADITSHDEPLDNLWMLVGGILVFFMHAGFSMLETGTVRFKNAQNILSKNLLVVCLGFLTWFFLGYGFALGETDVGHFFGWSNFAGYKFSSVPATPAEYTGNEYRMREWFFQGAFCATSATIVSGAMAERTDIVGFMIYTFVLTTFVYPFVVHWGWSGVGFLGYTDAAGETTSVVPGFAYSDFAGSGIVHMVGGVGALIGAVVVGPRNGRFSNPDEFAPHNIPICVLGTVVLWFGWYGFNGASTLSMKTPSDAYTSALVCVNTTLSPSIAAIVVFLLRAKVVAPKSFDVCGICNGILAGLVSITAPCGSVKPWEALIIGFIGAFVYQGVSMGMQKLKIDDPLDAFAVHGACGLWGVLCVGIFGEGQGLLYGEGQLGIQLVGAIFIALWVAVWSIPVFLILKALNLLRVADEIQEIGLDEHEHSPSRALSWHDVLPSKVDAASIVSSGASTGTPPSPPPECQGVASTVVVEVRPSSKERPVTAS